MDAEMETAIIIYSTAPFVLQALSLILALSLI